MTFPMPWVLSKDELRAIKVPMLLLVGSDEVIYKPKDGIDRAKKFIPDLEARIVPNAGHTIIMDQPKEASRYLTEFFK